MEEQIRTAFTEMTEKIWGWIKALITNLPNLVVALIVFTITMIVARMLKRLIRRWMSRTRASKSVSSLVANFGAVVVILGGLYLGLAALDLDKVATGILTTASISGLIVGLALQNTFANTFAGIILSLIDDIQIGDWIESKGYKGEVQRITLRATTIRGADNNLVFLPNKEVIDNPLRNLSKTSMSRIILECGVAYWSDLIKVREVTKKAIKGEFEDTMEDQIDFYYTAFADSAITFTVRYWVNARNAIEESNAKSRGIVAIKQAFDKEGINIPFPIRTLFFGEPAQVMTRSMDDSSSLRSSE